MKSQKVIAMLLSMALSVSACMPLGNITALGAEAETTAEAVEVQEEVSDSEESMEPSEEEEVPSEAEAAGQAAVEDEDDSSDEQEAAVEETETAETEDTENVTSESGDEDNESADEADTAETAQDAEAPQTSEESDFAAPEQAPAPAAETPAEDQADLTAPAETETVKTDAQNSLVTPDDFSNAAEIKAGDSYDVSIAEEDEYVLYRFVPEEDGRYIFFSAEETGDPKAALYSEDESLIDTWDDENGSNFKIDYDFTAGETYYFEAGTYGGTGFYTVYLVKKDFSVERVGERDRTVSPKEEITLEVSATSSGEVSYQWICDDEPIAGADSAAYTFTPQKNGQYICRVSSESGDSEDVFFNITIENNFRAYVINQEGDENSWTDIILTPNTSANLKVNVSADDMTGITYEWRNNDDQTIAGATASSYTINAAAGSQIYHCNVTDKYDNSQTVTFYVRVENHLDAYVIDESGNKDNYLAIFVPTNTSAQLNFTLSADDKTGLTYQWRDDQGDPIQGAGTTSCTVGPVTQREYYYVTVQDRYNNSASVEFMVAPLDYSGAKTINVGDSVQISVNENAPYALYTFTPTATVQCTLYSSDNDGDPYVEVFNNSYKRLFYDDDEDDSSNFNLEEVFDAGTTYYIRARAYSIDSDASFTMHLKKSDPIDISTASVTGIVNKTYNGAAQTQAPVVKIGSAALKAGTDYTLSYRNNINAGTATVTITGKGNCTGTVSKNFTIAKAAQSFRVSAASTVEPGKTMKITASGAKETSKYNFVSSNTGIATVSSNGTVTGKNLGTVVITVSTAATANYNAASWPVRITVNKVLKKPGYCHFVKWNNKNYTGCRIAWNRVVGAEGYETHLCWTNGSHSSVTTVGPNVLYRDCKVYPNHVSCINVRAFYTLNGRKVYGPWSNMEFITPSPTRLTCTNVSRGGNLQMKVSWPIIYGSNGYNVFITTNPNGKWSWNQSTAVRANALSAVITKYQGGKLKKNTRYYVRIVTRRKFKNVFCSVPMPARNTYVGSFVIK